ncbi:MAG: hypothetical protein EA344_00410 [Alkalicoccus sp.]|nr:MAG: hypothetical protein EA344_00410 [Alkalicoccus sp.]
MAEACHGAGLQLFSLRRDLTALHPAGVSAVTEGKSTLYQRKQLKYGGDHGRKFLPIFLLHPQEGLLGHQGRGEDPFRKKLAEPGPPGKRKQGIVYLYIKNTLSTA